MDDRQSRETSRETENRRIRRFGFRTIVVLAIMVAAVVVSLVTLSEPESRIAQQIRVAGGAVAYDQNECNVSLSRFTHARRRAITSVSFVDVTVSDDLIAVLGTLPALRRVSLRNVTMSSNALDGLVGLESLDALYLHGSTVNDQSLRSIGKLTSLRSLDLTGAQVTPVGLAHLTGLTRLEELTLDVLEPNNDVLEIVAKLPVRTVRWGQDLRFREYNAADMSDHSASTLREWFQSTRPVRNPDSGYIGY